MGWEERPIELIAEVFDQELGGILTPQEFAERVIRALRAEYYFIVWRPEGDNRPT
jgi:hypothetical protein